MYKAWMDAFTGMNGDVAINVCKYLTKIYFAFKQLNCISDTFFRNYESDEYNMFTYYLRSMFNII